MCMYRLMFSRVKYGVFVLRVVRVMMPLLLVWPLKEPLWKRALPQVSAERATE